MRRFIVPGLLAALLALPTGTLGGSDETAGPAVGEPSKAKQTTLGLYVTSAEAYGMWERAGGELRILDVRTPEEYMFIGHAKMAWNIPFFFTTHKWNEKRGSFSMEPNPEFVSEVKNWASPGDTILVMCRSGGRSAMAINRLAEAGFTNVFNITDGMEGDKVDDPGSLFHGKRLRNGWKNTGLPWTYKLDRERIRIPEQESVSQ